MRRAIARGRLVPQSRSTDPRMGRVSLKAATLYDRMWINCDDQGRLSGDPDEIKYSTCPNLPDISQQDIPELLKELESQALLRVFSTSRHTAIQMLDWWEDQKLQWAYPSSYPPPSGWTDHLRYHPTPTEIVTINWPPNSLPSEPPSKLPSELPSELQPDRESSKEIIEKGKGTRKGKGRGRGRLPSALGSTSSPSLAGSELFQNLVDTFPKAWGRMPDSRETAQLRDLGDNLSSAGGASAEQVYDAFKEAAMQRKLSISYIRAILLDWLGVERNRSP